MARLRSKFEATYEKLFEGQSISKIAPREDPTRFWADMFALDVDSVWLANRLNALSREECVHEQKVLLGQMFRHALTFFTQSTDGDGAGAGAGASAESGSGGEGEEQRRKRNALETLVVFFHAVLQKDLAGWEIMDLLSGTMSESDLIFGRLVEGIESTLENPEAPVALKHRTLQLALVFACGIGQLSPGAYLLRRDLFPSIVMLIKLPETTPFTFESILLISVLLNYHKSEAANLNPYLRRVRGSVDHTFLSKACWALGYAFDTVSKKYQEIQDDTPPSLASTFGSFLTALRPDRALSSTPVETPKELFKDQPIEAAAGLLPLYELLQLNPVFTSVIVESLTTEGGASSSGPTNRPPMIFSFVSLASYLFTHASSVGTPRSLSYANLTMRIIALMTSDEPMTAKFARESGNIRICRQRLPRLPESPTSRPILCSILDCLVLWLRHNLHKKLEVSSYRSCIYSVHSILWMLGRQRIRLEYHWEELWKSIFLLLEFTSSRVDNVKVLGRVDELIEETLIALELATLLAERLVPTPEALHQFVYELVRSKDIVDRQLSTLTALEVMIPSPSTQPRGVPLTIQAQALRAIKTIQGIITYYEGKINEKGTEMEIGDVMNVIATEVERDGLQTAPDREPEGPTRRLDSSSEGFVKWACRDGLALLSSA